MAKDQIRRVAIPIYRMLLRVGEVNRNLVHAARSGTGAGAARSPSHYFLRLGTQDRPVRMLLTRPGQFEDTLVAYRSYEPHITAIVEFFLNDGDVYVDVGANIGSHALQVAAAKPKARVVCFEAHPAIHHELVRNLEFSKLENITTQNVAAGERTGTVEFFAQEVDAYNRGLSSRLPNYDLGDAFTKTEAPMAPLDAAIEPSDRAHVRVVKIDTQGSELEVLQGMPKIISTARPIVIFEFVSDYLDHPCDNIAQIIDLLPNYEVWRLEVGEPAAVDFDVAEVSKPGFWADLVCLPTEIL